MRNTPFTGSLYTRRRWWFCCYLYQWYNLWCKTLSNKQSAACYSRFHYSETRNISQIDCCHFGGNMGHVGKVGCVSPRVIDSILPHVEFGSNDHREDTPHFTFGPASWCHPWCSLLPGWKALSATLSSLLQILK